MKLLYCPKCHDIVLLTDKIRHCHCEKSFGRYTDNVNVEVTNGKVLGINNSSFFRAITSLDHENNTFEAFVIPDNAPSITRTIVKTISEYYD